MKQALILYAAQGFGVGRIPVAPGTFGTLVGLLWFLLLAATGSFWIYLAGTLAGLGGAVWICGAAEKILKQTDPGSVVLDEIAAVPVCFLAWMATTWHHDRLIPGADQFLTGRTWDITLIILAIFRLFDILKPWPVHHSQRLPGGWGVTIDDVIAAAYVALITLLFVG